MANTNKIHDTDGVNRTFKQYVKKRINILKELCIWNKLSIDEKSDFQSCTDDHQIDNMMREFRYKYL